MSLFKKLFNLTDKPISNYSDFWSWFKENETQFKKIVLQEDNIETKFLNVLISKLNQLKDGFFLLVGITEKNVIELVFTADGAIENMVFMEDLVKSAPLLSGWKFSALKQPGDILDLSIELNGYLFNERNVSFYVNENSNYPDLVDLTFIYDTKQDANLEIIEQGIYLLLENYLGELEFVTQVDSIDIQLPNEPNKELIPLRKLSSYLAWREKEFIEKYQGKRESTEKDQYSILEAKGKNGKQLIAMINTDLLNWDKKPSHPWMLIIEIGFDGSKNNGMPDEQMMTFFNQFETDLMQELKDSDGYLNIGRETFDGIRTIYFACKDFRLPSKAMAYRKKLYKGKLKLDYQINRDKYWLTLDKFKGN